ncbi:MAG: hypothetical protein HY731_06105 [Candidatus Tectomicrobia bacterium]|nr:hypothetical protein [Candidatus Tectomicrobia bacterium]
MCKNFFRAHSFGHCKHAVAVAEVIALREQQGAQAEPPDDDSPPVPEAELATTPAFSAADLLKPWIVEIYGQKFVRFARLLQLAHTQGLKSLSVKPLHVTNQFAVAEAMVEMADGRTFSELGDATPGNANKNDDDHTHEERSNDGKIECTTGFLQGLGGMASSLPSLVVAD